MYRLEARKNQSLTGAIAFDLPEQTTDKFDNFLYHILLNTTLQTLLHHEDRNSMAFSIESRVPFLDHRLVEFAFLLLTQDRISNKAETKFILREGLKSVLPKAVYERKDKKGFVTPGEVEWLNGPLKFLLEDNFSGLGFMNVTEAKALIEQYKKGDYSKAGMVWKLAATNYWIKQVA
jgi:asparagine synthase (glutamine-hydrolysing)